MSTFALKLTALVLMLLDHIGSYFAPPMLPIGLCFVLRSLGRGAYPLFLFCLAQGYAHTRSRKKYLLRLYCAGLFMAFFSLWVERTFPAEEFGYYGNHNIFVPMLLVGLIISAIEAGQRDRRKGLWLAAGIFALQFFYQVVSRTGPFRHLSGDTMTGLIPNLNLAINEYGFDFIILGVAMYFLRDKSGALAAAYIVFCAYQFILGEYSNQFLMIWVLPLMLRYNGEKGRGLKWLFYVFYPVHTFLLFYLANFAAV